MIKVKFNQQPKTILITGCSSGIGLATALFLKQQNWRVFATVRRDDDKKRLEKQGLETFLLDLDDSNSIKKAVQEILQSSDGQLSALCNNAAYGLPAALEDVSREALRAQFETNLFGTHELTNAILPVMRQQGYGRIIQISSVLGLVAMGLRGAYNASKYALEGLTDTLRLELKGSNIDVVLIEPGPIDSQFRANAQKSFEKWVDIEKSVFSKMYKDMYQQRIVKNKNVPFTLPSEAVAKLIKHTLNVRTPKARYYITVPTFIFGYLRRILSTKWLDYVLFGAGMTIPKKSIQSESKD